MLTAFNGLDHIVAILILGGADLEASDQDVRAVIPTTID